MVFMSAHFGGIDVQESSTIEFPEGLPGFEERRRFVPLWNTQQGGLIFLQSLECPELCFLALPVKGLRPDYEIALTPEDREALGLPDGLTPIIGRDVVALAILSLVEGEAPTANLRSPVVIHARTRIAVQAIRPDELYHCREALDGNRETRNSGAGKDGAVCW
jgi:flagellar assembly factor FliW